MDKFDCLAVFISVAELGTFTAAANKMNTTQSAVSKKIAWLEKHVGIALFHRHARAVSLTAGGRNYLTFALKITEETATIESQLREEQASVSGVLTLSVPSAFSVRLLSKPLSEFLTLHPKLTVDVSVSDKFVDLVENGVDVAIRAAYLKDSGLRAKWFMNNELVYFAAPNYLNKHPAITEVNDLALHQCLTYSLSTPSNIWRFGSGKDGLKVKVTEQLRSDSPEMLVQMAKLGQGITAMPKWMVEEELRAGSLQMILENAPKSELPMYLIYKDSEHQPQRIRAFIDFLADYFEQRK